MSRYAGNRGVLLLLLRRDVGGTSEFLFVSLWDSTDSVWNFAGPDVEKAVLFGDEGDYLTDMGTTAANEPATSPATVMGFRLCCSSGPV